MGRRSHNTEASWGQGRWRCRVGGNGMWYLIVSAFRLLGLQVLADVAAGAETPVRGLLVDLPDVAVRLGGRVPEGEGMETGDRCWLAELSIRAQGSPGALHLQCQRSDVQHTDNETSTTVFWPKYSSSFTSITQRQLLNASITTFGCLSGTHIKTYCCSWERGAVKAPVMSGLSKERCQVWPFQESSHGEVAPSGREQGTTVCPVQIQSWGLEGRAPYSTHIFSAPVDLLRTESQTQDPVFLPDQLLSHIQTSGTNLPNHLGFEEYWYFILYFCCCCCSYK